MPSFPPEPCCPANLKVEQVTQSMTNVSWSQAKGAHSFITSLTSLRGHASCHTQDSHCLMGCITCGTNYTVTMEAFSLSGRMANCTYQGFSSSKWFLFSTNRPICEYLVVSPLWEVCSLLCMCTNVPLQSFSYGFNSLELHTPVFKWESYTGGK